MMRRVLLASLLPFAAPPATAQQRASFDFTIKNIMRGPEVYGREPQNVRWSADGRWIYFTWLEPGSDWRLPARAFRVRATPGAKPERVSETQMDSVAPLLDSGRFSADGRLKVVSSGGDLFVIDMKWWLVPCPVEDHGFVRPDSWTDEYSRIFTLFETTVRHGKSAAQNAASLGGTIK